MSWSRRIQTDVIPSAGQRKAVAGGERGQQSPSLSLTPGLGRGEASGPRALRRQNHSAASSVVRVLRRS